MDRPDPTLSPIPDRGYRFLARFAERAMVIACVDQTICERVSTLLRHCRADERDRAPTRDVDTFDVRPDGDRFWLLARNDSIVGRGLSADDVVERVVYEVTVALATGCRDLLAVHGAGVSRGDGGVLLCGESGCGKSTLTTRMLADGWDFLSDEIIAVAPDGRTMIGFPRAIALKDTAVLGTVWPDHAPAMAWPPDRRTHLDPEWIRPGSVRHQATLHILVFPRYRAGTPVALRAMSRAETVYRLMPRLVNGEQLPSRGFAAAGQLARAIPAYSLSYPDASQAMSALDEIVRFRAQATDA